MVPQVRVRSLDANLGKIIAVFSEGSVSVCARHPERSEGPRVARYTPVREGKARRTAAGHNCFFVCHPEQSEARAERSRRTPFLIASPSAFNRRSHQKENSPNEKCPQSASFV